MALERLLGDLDAPFPWEEIEYNRCEPPRLDDVTTATLSHLRVAGCRSRCALQLSTQTGLDEIHSLFSFMSMGQVWITLGGQLQPQARPQRGSQHLSPQSRLSRRTSQPSQRHSHRAPEGACV